MLEALLDSQIATASDLALLRKSVARPREQVWTYDKLKQPFETELYRELKSRFGDIAILEKLFRFAYDASSNLGAWCSDLVWSYGLSEVVLPKLEGRVDRSYLSGKHQRSNPGAQDEIRKLRNAREVIQNHRFSDLNDLPQQLSSKVLLLFQKLSKYYETPTDTKCIVFTDQRHTARLLGDLFARIGSQHLRTGVLIGVRSSDYGGMNISFREQILTLMRFRNGELNCLVSLPHTFNWYTWTLTWLVCDIRGGRRP
jgi:endoribonuclease Dicer